MLGKYRQLSLLGKGSMGTVYLAEHTLDASTFDRVVTSKEITHIYESGTTEQV